MTRIEAFMALAAQWQELHPEAPITHKTADSLPQSVLDSRLAYINDGLRLLTWQVRRGAA